MPAASFCSLSSFEVSSAGARVPLGQPHFGQFGALSDMVWVQSGQLMSIYLVWYSGGSSAPRRSSGTGCSLRWV